MRDELLSPEPTPDEAELEVGETRTGSDIIGEEGGLQFLFYLRRRGGEGGGALASSEAASEILLSGYKPDDSPMHDHMDSEDFLMRTSL